jgi:demethylmenaquinone methyltransferase/2-methoxy-6-polyprenyl-1,4-benzoquinol methylase
MGAKLAAARREFFDDLAARWDMEVATDSFMLRLREVVAGLDIGQAEVVLDLGCGTGNLTALLAESLSARARIVAADLSEGMLERAREKLPDEPRIEWVHADAAELPLPDGGIDRVICLSTWPHFAEPERIAGELHRILRPGGLFHVLHLDGRETINGIHRAIGGPVAEDLLPPAVELGALLVRAGFESREVRDEPDHYQVTVARRLV